MHREAESKLIAIGYLSAIMNFIIHTHINIFFKNCMIPSNLFRIYQNKLRPYIRPRICKKNIP